jgi:hypothetical protein
MSDRAPSAFEIETRALAVHAVADSTHARIVAETALLALIAVGAFVGQPIEDLTKDVDRMANGIAPALPHGAGELLAASMAGLLESVRAAVQRQREAMN